MQNEILHTSNSDTLTLHIRVTKKCNADCSYCSSFERITSKVMTLEEFRVSLEFIKEKIITLNIAGKRKHLTVQYVGGEILTVGTDYLKNIKDIVDETFKGFFETVLQGVQSNLIASEERVKNLFKIFSGNVGTSYDNHTEQRTVKQNPQAYQKIFFTNLNKIKRTQGLIVPGIVVIDKAMYPHTLDELKIANKNYRHITLRPTFQGGSPITSILEPELTHLYEELFNEWFMKMKIAVEPFFSLLTKRLENIKNNQSGMASFSGCPFQHNCATSSLNLEPNGDLYVCLDMADSKHYPLGNALDKTFKDDVFAMLKARSQKLNDDCIKCDYFKECQGGCMNEAIESTGDVYGKTHYCGTWKKVFSMIDEGIKVNGIEAVEKWTKKISSR